MNLGSFVDIFQTNIKVYFPFHNRDYKDFYINILGVHVRFLLRVIILLHVNINILS